MLVLTRRLNESILIGDEIEITIVQVKGAGDQAVIRLGISAPKHISVLRREVFEEIVAANRQSASLLADLPFDILQAVDQKSRPEGKKRVRST